MEHYWRSATAGILDIISGVGMLFVCFWLVLAGGIVGFLGSDVPQWLAPTLFAVAIAMAVLALLAIIGGIFCIRRKAWGMALTGAIAAFFCFFVLGAISIVLTAFARSEFNKR